MVAYDYPLLSFFWSVFIFFGFFLWIWLLITVFMDLFRSHDLSGFAKAAWFIFVLVIPLVGVLMYLIVRGHKMHEHAAQAAQEQDAAFKQYVQDAASDGSTAAQLSKLADLRDRGVIDETEFAQQKAKILS